MVFAQWVLNKERTSVPMNITIRLVNVKYLTNLNGLTFSSVAWRFINKINGSAWEYRISTREYLYLNEKDVQCSKK